MYLSIVEFRPIRRYIIKEYIKDHRKFGAAAAPVAAAADTATAAKVESEEEEDDDMGFGLFD